MGSTIAEKILARTAGRDTVSAGEEIMAKPDFVLAYDFPGYTDVYFKTMKEDFGIEKVAEPERFGIFIDHMVPVITPQEEEFHEVTRKWCADNNVPLFEKKGIGHQVSCEVGYATPGAFVVHFDGHVSQLGTYGTLAIGIRRNILEAFVRDQGAAYDPCRSAWQLAAGCDGTRRVPSYRARARARVLQISGAGDRRPGHRSLHE